MTAAGIAGSRPLRRAQLVLALTLVTWVVLAVRLVQLQYTGHERFAERAIRQSRLVARLPARPGDILDRHGRVLATTVTARSLYLVPSRIESPGVIASQLATVLELDPSRLVARLAAARSRQFLWCRRRLSEDEAKRVRGLGLPEGTWGFRDEFLRRYPQGRLAAAVVGLRDIDGRGRGGLEQLHDERLAGRDGNRVLVRDARGRVIAVAAATASRPRDGRDVSSTIDAVIQLHAERALDRLVENYKPRGAVAIVMAPDTGEVLAMASWPAGDPNLPGQIAAEAWRNRAICDSFEPGSTFKPLIVAFALQRGVIARDEVFDCENGVYRMGPRVLHDHHPYGELGLVDVLVKSSNIGMAKIGERLKNRGLYEAAVAFGFGRVTGLGLPGEINGRLRRLAEWNRWSTGSVPMGHELTVTPLQLICGYAVLANRGRSVTPRLVPAPTSVATSPSAPSTGQVVSAELAEWMLAVPLRQVVERGTGRRARLPGIAVFGKTGTAQKRDPRTGRYSRTSHVASFVCGAPVERPRVLVLVVVDEPAASGPQTGGRVAAPAAASILKQTLAQPTRGPLAER